MKSQGGRLMNLTAREIFISFIRNSIFIEEIYKDGFITVQSKRWALNELKRIAMQRIDNLGIMS